MSKYYVLNEDHSVRELDSLEEWARLFEGDQRRVGQDEIGDVMVSTVFLGIDHRFGEGAPLLFETMIFGGKHDQEQWRYSTWREAVDGHERAVKLVRDSDRNGEAAET